jgi:hypothetical protein
MALSAPLQASEHKSVIVEYGNPDKFTDIKYFNGSKKKFQQRLFKDWEQFLSKEAGKILPKNYTLKISFTDIDLAGTYMLGGIDQNRIVRDIDYPRLKISYLLMNGEQVVKQAEVTLKDMNFLRHDVSQRRSFENFYHEKKLMKDWLNKELKPLLGSKT